MRNVAVAAVAATITLGAFCLTACAPEQPPVVGDAVETPTEPPCGGTVSGDQEACKER